MRCELITCVVTELLTTFWSAQWPGPLNVRVYKQVTTCPKLPRTSPVYATIIMNTPQPVPTYTLHDWGAPAHTGTKIKVSLRERRAREEWNGSSSGKSR